MTGIPIISPQKNGKVNEIKTSVKKITLSHLPSFMGILSTAVLLQRELVELLVAITNTLGRPTCPTSC
jgi:hypothetical protein